MSFVSQMYLEMSWRWMSALFFGSKVFWFLMVSAFSKVLGSIGGVRIAGLNAGFCPHDHYRSCCECPEVQTILQFPFGMDLAAAEAHVKNAERRIMGHQDVNAWGWENLRGYQSPRTGRCSHKLKTSQTQPNVNTHQKRHQNSSKTHENSSKSPQKVVKTHHIKNHTHFKLLQTLPALPHPGPGGMSP